MLHDQDGGDYVDLESVRQEIAQVRRMCAERKWPMIDVTRRSIEETAATILQLLAKRAEAAGKPVPAAARSA